MLQPQNPIPIMKGMSLKSNYSSSPWSYAPTAILLHWVLAILIVGMAALGWYMMSIEKQPDSGWYFDFHKSVGLIVATLVALRLIWRISHSPAPLPKLVPNWQRKLSAMTQALLYVCMIILPTTGILGASYSKDGLLFFGAALPRWAQPNHDIAELFFSVHGIAVWVLVGLVSLHVLGGLKHLMIDRDGVFQRMLPKRRGHC